MQTIRQTMCACECAKAPSFIHIILRFCYYTILCTCICLYMSAPRYECSSPMILWHQHRFCKFNKRHTFSHLALYSLGGRQNTYRTRFVSVFHHYQPRMRALQLQSKMAEARTPACTILCTLGSDDRGRRLGSVGISSMDVGIG